MFRARPALILAAACVLSPLHAGAIQAGTIETGAIETGAIQEMRALHSEHVIVVRRGWHIDVGFAAADLETPLRSIASDLPASRFIFFGFGDMHYLMSKTHNPVNMSAALWPGRGIMLVTGVEGTPQQGFGAEHVIELDLAPEDARALQESIWNSFATSEGAAKVYRSGPYAGSLYYLSTARYSALHTCNTWAAQVLKAGGLHVRTIGTLFAGQLWTQVRRLQRLQAEAPSAAAPSMALMPPAAN